MLNMGLCRASKSNWASPLHMLLKKEANGGLVVITEDLIPGPFRASTPCHPGRSDHIICQWIGISTKHRIVGETVQLLTSLCFSKFF